MFCSIYFRFVYFKKLMGFLLSSSTISHSKINQRKKTKQFIIKRDCFFHVFCCCCLSASLSCHFRVSFDFDFSRNTIKPNQYYVRAHRTLLSMVCCGGFIHLFVCLFACLFLRLFIFFLCLTACKCV